MILLAQHSRATAPTSSTVLPPASISASKCTNRSIFLVSYLYCALFFDMCCATSKLNLFSLSFYLSISRAQATRSQWPLLLSTTHPTKWLESTWFFVGLSRATCPPPMPTLAIRPRPSSWQSQSSAKYAQERLGKPTSSLPSLQAWASYLSLLLNPTSSRSTTSSSVLSASSAQSSLEATPPTRLSFHSQLRPTTLTTP